MTDVLSASLLPDSRARTITTVRGAVCRAGVWHQPLYCANCGADGGLVPEAETTFAFYLCKPCFEAYGAIAGTYAVPDEVFWARVLEETRQSDGRALTPAEMVAALADPDSVLSRLARDRAVLTPSAGD